MFLPILSGIAQVLGFGHLSSLMVDLFLNYIIHHFDALIQMVVDG
jgi:hypothetical protein